MKKLLFIIPALTPLYLIKISLFGLPTNVFELLAVAALLLTFPQWRNIALQKLVRENKVFCWGVLFIILGLISSLLYNKTYSVSFGILKSWFLFPIVFSFILYSALKTREDVLFVLKSIYVSVFAVALISIIYKLTHIVTFDNRLQAFYNSPNYLAMFLAPEIFLGFYFLKLSWKNMVQKYLYFISLIIIALSLYFTYSYAAWISILATFILLYFFKNKTAQKAFSLKAATFFLAVVLILFTSQLPNQKFLDIINKNPRSSFASRMMIWESSLKMITDSPIFGIGAGNFQTTYLAYQKYFPPYLEWAVPQPHNLFLAFWLESGLIGLVGFAMVTYSLLRLSANAIKKEQDHNLAFLLLAIFLYIVLHGLADTTYWKNDLSFLFWIFAFLAIAISRESQIDAV